MKNKKIISFCLAGMFFVEGVQAGSLEDIEKAFEKTAGVACEEQEGLLKQLDETYLKLNHYESSLEKARSDRPYVEHLRDIRNTAAVMTAAAGIIMAVGLFKARTAKEGQYSLIVAGIAPQIAKAAVLISGTATAMAEAGYVLSNDEIVEFSYQVKRTKSVIQSLRDQLRNCR